MSHTCYKLNTVIRYNTVTIKLPNLAMSSYDIVLNLFNRYPVLRHQKNYQTEPDFETTFKSFQLKLILPMDFLALSRDLDGSVWQLSSKRKKSLKQYVSFVECYCYHSSVQLSSLNHPVASRHPY